MEEHALLARLLAVLPAWLTGRIEPRARREVRSWTKNNATLRTLEYGKFRRFLMWSTDHPVVFALSAGVVSASIAYLFAVQKWTIRWRLAAPDLKDGFDVAAYTGVPWSVQVTLVALVYPIVLSFIALMLQRKAHSTVALRVYVLDSAVVPAGASSIGLLVAMGAQYFATPYSTSTLLAEYMASLLVLTGTWLLINVVLTSFFLSRTIRFIQDEEQRHAFTRVAVDVVLRSELVSAVKQHIFVNAAQSDWNFPGISSNDGPGPQVHMFAGGASRPQVKRDLRGSLVLHDVHLHLLKLVANNWNRRAAKLAPATEDMSPTLIFPPRVGGIRTGEVVLCAVNDGPALNVVERLLVRMAYVYRPSRQGTLSLSTRKMLEEIAGEVEAAAEQQRFGAAQERLRDLLRLHKTLLLASSADSEGLAGNAATIGTSPYSWGDSSFGKEWLKPYWDVGRIAVSRLDEDPRLFGTLSIIPASIAADLPSRPEKLLIDAQNVGTNLASQLAGWWTHRADASLLPGATFGGTLPAPLGKVYEQAMVTFVGNWGEFHVDVPNDFECDDAQAWQAFTGRAFIYAKHIENSASLFLKAVSRGDETAAGWLLDNLLKWWGNRRHELECRDIERDFRVQHVTMRLAEKDWPAAQGFMCDGSEPVTIRFANMALSLAIRRYWQSIRLYVVLLLIQNAGSSPAADSPALRHAAALIRGNARHAGGSVDVSRLDTIDEVLSDILGNVFGIETAVRRIEEFAETLRWDDETHHVPGWLYSWSGTPTDLESMKHAQAVLLASLASARKCSVVRSKKLIERWWKDIDKLDAVVRYCADLRREVLSSTFADAHGTVSILKRLLENTHPVRSGRLATAVALKTLCRVARRERRLTLSALSVDQTKVRNLSQRIATHVFDASRLPPPVVSLNFVAEAAARPMSLSFTDEKKRYLETVEKGPDLDLAEHVGDRAREILVAFSFSRLVKDNTLTPVNTPALRQDVDASHATMQAYLVAVASQCSAFQSAGTTPVVLVGRSAVEVLLRAHRWGAEAWKCPIPQGILVSDGEAENVKDSVSQINGVPVFEFDTPNGDCYVLPAALLDTLSIAGGDAISALSVAWMEEGEDQLKFTLSWEAAFSLL